jgi:ketosteroid isomerase-like protein
MLSMISKIRAARVSFLTRAFAAAALLATAVVAPAQASADAASDTAIKAMMQKSVDDWNRHDIDAFATSYKNSPDILFIGRKTSRGYAQMLATYKAAYSTPEKMGRLSFTQLETQPLDANFATVTAHFHLERTAAGGGNADGYFLLVVEHTPAGWKIVRDDSTSLPPATTKP